MFAALEYGTRFRIGDQEYEIRKVKQYDTFEVYNITYDTMELITLEELKIAFNETNKSKKLLFRLDGEYPLKEPAKWDLDLYTPEQKLEMNNRFAVIEPYLLGYIKDLKSYIKTYPTEFLPKLTPKLSIATFYRWVQKYRKWGNKICLIPRTTGPKGRRITIAEADRLREFIEETDKKAEAQTIRDKWLLYIDGVKKDNLFRGVNDQIPIISESTFRRVFKEMHNPRQRNIQIMGTAQADLLNNGVRGAIIAERPLQYIELDWTPLDYIIVNFDTDETFRPIVMHAVDKYSDEPLGYIIIFKEQPNAGDWKQLLLHVMLPKTGIKELYPKVTSEWSGFGVPENIIMDNAPVNDCEEVAEVCGTLGIGLIYNEKGAGHQKGTIENALGNINRIFHALPGTTFSNNEKRGQYNSRKKACVNINGLHHMIHIALIEFAANKYNRGVGGIPETLWHEGLKNARVQRQLPYRREYLELLFASETDYRVLGPKGIELKGEFFFSEEVNQLRLRINKEGRNRKVRVRFGIDLRRIFVYDEFNKRYLEAHLKQSSRLVRHQIDQRYPVHVEHLSYLCNKNNSDAYDFLKEQENVTHGLKALEQLVNEGKKEYSQTKRQRRKREAQSNSIVSAVNGSLDIYSAIPENPNIILVETESQKATIQQELDNIPAVNQSDAATISSIIASDEIDLKLINSTWSKGRKVR